MTKDYLVRQAEQLGQALAIILSKLLGLKDQQKGSIEMSVVNHFFEEELDINIDRLLSIPTEAFVSTLKSEKGFNNDSLEILADILFTVANEISSDKKTQLYEKSLAIFEELSHSEKKTYSYSRELKMSHLKKRIALSSKDTI